MSYSNNGGTLVFTMWTLTIILTGIAGILSWDWIEPNGLWGFIGFLILWGILSKVAHLISMALVTLFSSKN
jgi:hypothetical protein